MADILKAAKAMPGFCDAAHVQLVEMSPTLRKLQQEKLGQHVIWHESFASVAEAPMVLIANEFFDAIPIRQFEKRDRQWFERCLGEKGLGFMPAALDVAQGMNGDVIEFAPQRQAIAEEIGARLAKHPGAALIIDYGHLKTAPGDTLQAVRAHHYVPITHLPGETDITSHVDFEALGRALVKGGATTYAGISQRSFLLAMGIEPRMAMLAAKADKAEAEIMARAVERLIGESEMGNLFKVMVGTSPGLATPYPFGTS
jgi:NADH dehydrogenase [ubiquinone] 1 alpha subcomplex assembly factor 7